MNSNYLLSMLDLVGNSLELQQWLGPHPPTARTTSLLSCIGLLKAAQPKLLLSKVKGGSDWSIPVSGWSMMTLFLSGYPPSIITCPFDNFTAQWEDRGPGKSGPGWDASPSGDTYSLVARSLSPSQPPKTNNLPFTGTLAL